MPDIREVVIEIHFIAKRAIGNLVKFFGVAELRHDNCGQRMFWLPDLPLLWRLKS
jgi:hypothetical protein